MTNPSTAGDQGEASTRTVVHPRQLGIDDVPAYSIIIDARTPHEYAEDHLPGAVNLPVVDDTEFAEVGTTHVTDPHAAYVIGAAYASTNIASHIRSHIATQRPGSRLLVYCFRGGKRSRVWADTLRNIGFDTDVLKGGWKAYRRWVMQSLAVLPASFEYRVLAGLTGCGKTRLLHALERQGCQVLDLEGLASHRGSLLGSVPGEPQPTQKAFDSALLARLRSFDPGRPVWVEAESKKVGNVQLPPALFDAMRSSQPLHIDAPIDERVRLLIEDYPHLANRPHDMVDKLEPLKPLVGSEELASWRALADTNQVARLFERVLVAHYDPSYLRSRERSPFHAHADIPIVLQKLDPAHLADAAAELDRRYGRCRA
jgi:tRNA 2-selenouridine synthase